MGRGTKTKLCADGVDRRETGYYSTPGFVAQFLASEMIRLSPYGKYVLDPAVGKEELLEVFHKLEKEIDSIDVEDFGNHHKSNFVKQDFLDFYSRLKDYTPLFGSPSELRYDYYICNPPYNCHETNYIRNNKADLRFLFSEIGVFNMYSMFLYAIIDLAKNGAVIGLVTHDSFLTSRMHGPLRDFILRTCSVHGLFLCPTDLFRSQGADVRTCLMILQKGKQFQGLVKYSGRPSNSEKFKELLNNSVFDSVTLDDILLDSKIDNNEFVVGCPREIKDLFRFKRISDTFECVTGISTGDDSRYLSAEKTDYFTVPFYKNPGSRKFRTEPDAFLPKDFLAIGTKVSNFIVRNKSFLFREGITCSSMGIPFSACYLPQGSTFGVNANIFGERAELMWLLAYLNSSLVTYFVRGVLIRTNMITSGYVSRIPVVPLSEETKNALRVISAKALASSDLVADTRGLVNEIDDVLNHTLKFSSHTIREIDNFCCDLLRNT